MNIQINIQRFKTKNKKWLEENKNFFYVNQIKKEWLITALSALSGYSKNMVPILQEKANEVHLSSKKIHALARILDGYLSVDVNETSRLGDRDAPPRGRWRLLYEIDKRNELTLIGLVDTHGVEQQQNELAGLKDGFVELRNTDRGENQRPLRLRGISLKGLEIP